jgi:hypothetical protein
MLRMNKQHGVCMRGDDCTRTLLADAKPTERPGFAGRENGSPGWSQTKKDGP